MRRLSALVAALALAACFGRLSAWAAPAGDPHACCRGEAPAPAAPALAECCATPAVAAALRAPAPVLTVVAVLVLELPARDFAPEAVEAAAPPGPQTLRSAVPARAPPLA